MSTHYREHRAVGVALVLAALLLVAAAPAFAVTEITYWGPKAPVYVDSTEALVEEFNAENPDIHVTYLPQGQQGAGDQDELMTAVLGGVGPDVIWFNRISVSNMALVHTFKPLDKYITQSPILAPENFIAEVLKESTYQGTVYGLPVTIDASGLAYNKDLFEAGGLDSEKPPATWDEMREYADKLTRTSFDGTVEQLGINAHRFRGRGWFYTMAAQQRVSFASDDGAKALLNRPEIQKGVQWTVEAVDLLGGWEFLHSAKTGLQTGLVGMDPTQHAVIIDLVARGGQGFALGVAPTPVVPGGQPSAYVGGWALSVTNQIPENKMPAVIKFLEYMLAPETQAKRYRLDNNGWPTTNVALKQVFQELMNAPNTEVQQKYLQLTSIAMSRGNSPATIDIMKALEKAGDSIFGPDKKPISEALQIANDEVQIKLDEYFQR